jgi:transcriptional regulator GlxA family with amidase domain
MLRVGFVVTPGFPVMSLAALSVFEFANLADESPLYELEILSENGGPVSSTLGTTVNTMPFEGKRFDTLIIGGNTRVVQTSPGLCQFVIASAKTSRRISSICTGVFALADAGLINDRRVTTHWAFTEDLRAHMPNVNLDADRIFVVDGPILTAAGNSAGIDLALFMLENDYGMELAKSVARTLVIDYQRSGGQTQHSALMDINPKTDRIQNAMAYARRNLAKTIRVDELADVARLGPRQFSRTFRYETGMTPAKAIESLRLEAARLLIEQSRHPMSIVATETGFGDEERMRRAFVRAFGQAPLSFRRTAKAD